MSVAMPRRAAATALIAVSLFSGLVACGGGGGGSAGESAGPKLALLAGSPTALGQVDGAGESARFGSTRSPAVDSAGTLYLVDETGGSFRRISPDAVVTTLRYPLLASLRGRFLSPRYLAADSNGNIFVSDDGTIRRITPQGVVSTIAGAAQTYGSRDGVGSEARFGGGDGSGFDQPAGGGLSGIAADGSGNVFVGDSGNHTIRRLTAAGTVSTLAGSAGNWGNLDGIGVQARFGSCMQSFAGPPTCRSLTGLAIDRAGNLLAADLGNQNLRRVFVNAEVSTVAGPDARLGNCTSFSPGISGCRGPAGVATDLAGNVYVAASGHHVIRRLSPAGLITTFAGTEGQPGSRDGPTSEAQFAFPDGLATDGEGHVYVSDWGNHTIRKIAADGLVSTLAGQAGLPGSSDGTGTTARFFKPRGIAADGRGHVYVADSGNYTVRRISPTGEVTIVAGETGVAGALDTGTPISSAPKAVAVDSAGNLFVVDRDYHTIVKVTQAGNATVFAGAAGVPGSDDGIGSAARFHHPNALAIDGTDSLYVADTNNNIVRKITADGKVSTVAGLAGNPGTADGPATESRFVAPRGIATDGAGNVYVADAAAHTVRRISSAGVVTTVAGTPGTFGYVDGVGAAVRLQDPEVIAADAKGNVYLAQRCAVRRISAAGAVATVVGDANKCGFAAGGLPGGIPAATGLAVRGRTLYIALPGFVAVVSNVP